MRLLAPLLIVLIIFLVIFLSTNSEERVTVRLGTTSYDEVHLWWVIFVAFAAGAGFVALVALIEGATIRMSNRRLRKERNRLETEANFLRTQTPTDVSEPESPDPPRAAPGAAPLAAPRERARPVLDPPPSAPVYPADDDDPYAQPD